jgi:SAM-dependent methyltransferase
MPDIAANISEWGTNYSWSEQGDEWSTDFGGSVSQWYGSLLPRIMPFLPAGRILEIAPGFGRWTQFLKSYCNTLVGVDLSKRCVDHCKKRFENDQHIVFHQNDGRSLAMIEDASIDFIFSFDSLVHAEADVIKDYLGQIVNKLRPGGKAFLHHSNLGAYRYYFGVVRRIPFGKDWLNDTGLLQTCGHWRAGSMTAKKFREMAIEAGLACLSQELINWRGQLLIDSISVVQRSTGKEVPQCRIWQNRRFMAEARQIRKITSHYSPEISRLNSATGEG